MKIVVTILRYLLALLLLVFGAGKIFPFMPDPEGVPADAINYMEALTSANTMILVGIVEMLVGLSLLLKKYEALMLVVLMSISVNIILFHLTLDIEHIAPALFVFIVNIVLLYQNKDKYKALLES